MNARQHKKWMKKNFPHSLEEPRNTISYEAVIRMFEMLERDKRETIPLSEYMGSREKLPLSSGYRRAK